MKLVDPVIMKDEKLVYQIMQEALLLKSLDHENIIKAIDFFKLKNGKFISIMEYQDSYDLHQIVLDPETVRKNNKEFVELCYEVHDIETYLKEDFIVNVVD